MSKNVAIFLGKFQPPHLGHIRTILRIYKEYEKLIIGVTEDKKIMSTTEVCDILNEVFADFKSIEVHKVTGIVEKGTVVIPSGVDTVLSGNQKVLDKLSKEYKTKFIPRTEGIGYSATELRNNSMALKALSLSSLNIKMSVELVPIDQLRPLEQVLPTHLSNIADMVEKDGFIKKPLIVDRKYNIVLDGSHRYAYLLQEGYLEAPVLYVNYEDETIFVGNHLKHRFLKDKTLTISKAEVIDRALNEKLYPPRTTRHFFPFRKDDFPTLLERLRKGNKRDIGYLIANVSIENEIKMDTEYILEIDEEMEVIEKYLQEQRDTKNYLLEQIEMMKNANK